jgi:hypothetical protein
MKFSAGAARLVEYFTVTSVSARTSWMSRSRASRGGLPDSRDIRPPSSSRTGAATTASGAMPVRRHNSLTDMGGLSTRMIYSASTGWSSPRTSSMGTSDYDLACDSRMIVWLTMITDPGHLSAEGGLISDEHRDATTAAVTSAFPDGGS